MSKTGRDTCSCAFALYRLSASYTGPTVDVYYAGTTTTFYADISGNLGTALNATGTAYLSLVTATGGYIVKWYDQSGNNRHATQVYTNAPSLNYTSKYADFTTYAGASHMSLPSGTVPQKIAYTLICKHGLMNGTNGGFIGGGNNSTGQGNNFRLNGTTGYWNYWYGYDAPITATVTSGNVVTFKFDGVNLSAGGTTYGYVNSVLTTTTPNASRSGYTTGLAWNGQAGNEVLGKTTADVAMNGQMYFMLAFNSALSDPDRFAAENLSPYNKISFIPTTGPIDFLNVGAATNQTSGPIDLGTLQSQYKTFGGGTVDLNTCYSLVNGFSPAWCMDAANYQSGTKWKDANTINNYDMTVNASAYTPSWLDGTPTMRFDGAYGAAKYVVGGTLTTVPFTTSGTTMICFSAINNIKGTSASYDWDWRTLYRVGAAGQNPAHPVIIEYGLQNSGSSRMGQYGTAGFLSSGTDIVTGPVPVPYAYQQQNMLVHKFRNTSPYYEYQLNNTFTTYTITDVNASLAAGAGTASIGQWHNNDATTGSGSQWWGNVSAVFMYNSILTNAQLQDLYTRMSPRFYSFNNPAFGSLPVTSGLVGWYDGESWTGTQWTDKSGSGNHVTTYTGTINVTTFPNNVRKYLYGTAGNARMTWPAAILPSTYTLFHVAKYNGATRGRIFDGVTQNWLSGFWGGYSGLAYHQGWIGPNAGGKTVHGTNWVISSDQNTIYRSQGFERGNTGAGTAGQTYAQLTINNGSSSGETSDWAVATVIVFNRTLTTAEMQKMEKWLNITYNVVAAPNLTPVLVNPGTKSFSGGGTFSVTQNVVGTGTITWTNTAVSGLTLSSSSDTAANFTVAASPAISTQNITVTATNPSSVPCSVVFSLTNTVAALYSMTFPFTFTNMGKTGQSGPTAITYSPNPGNGTAYVLTLGTGTSAGMQRWYVPQTRNYTFVVAGAGNNKVWLGGGTGQNYNYTSYGAVVTVTLSLTAGHLLRFLVGQQGTQTVGLFSRGGGNGGTFVYNESTAALLVAAGGGGGSGSDTASGTGGAGTPASPYTDGTGRGLNGNTVNTGVGLAGRSGSFGAGGTGGGGGGANTQGYGGQGGGGYTGNGGRNTANGETATGGLSFTNGGTGGSGGNGPGGFGGGASAGVVGGAGAGGGGGYSGGGGGANLGNGEGGGGGGSWSTVAWSSIGTTNTGHGYITVT